MLATDPDQRRLSRLPPLAAAAARRILTLPRERPQPTIERDAFPGLIVHAPAQVSDVLREATRTALDAVGWPSHKEAIPLPTSLTQPQRALAELLARRDDVPVHAYAMPRDGWSRRRWLGMVPPGELERPAEAPLWHALAALERDQAALGERLAQEPPARRYRAWVEVCVGAYRFNTVGIGPEALADLPLVPGLPAWALAVAREVLSNLGGGPARHGGSPQGLKAACRIATAALVEAGIPLEPRFEALWTPGFGDWAPHALRTARAIPADRRGAVLAAALRDDFASSDLRCALLLLEELPEPPGELMHLVIERCDELIDSPGPSRASALDRLERAVARDPVLAARFAAWKADQPPPVELTCLRAFRPSGWSDLDPMEAEQMRIADEWWSVNWGHLEGDEYPEGENGWAYSSVLHLADAAGTPLYDVCFYMDEDGLLFHAGTTDVFASQVQMRLAVEDPRLREALQTVLRANRPPVPT